MIRWMAPSFRACSSFSSEDDVAMTFAPDAAASWRPKIDTPPVPCTSTQSPPFSGVGPFRALYAVSAAHGRVDASSYVRWSGTRTSDCVSR